MTTSSLASQSQSSVRIAGSWRQPVLWLWIAFTIFAIFVFSISIRLVYQESLELCDSDDCTIFNLSPEDLSYFEENGIPYETPAVTETVGGIITVVVYVLIAGIIIFRRPDELIAIITAFAFVGLGITTPISALPVDNLLWDAGIRMITAVAVIGLTGFLLTFPNGRFAPGWTRWFFILLIPVNIIITVTTLLDMLDRSIYFSLLTLQLLLPFLTQVYRYFRIATPVERQQTKWVVAAALVQILLGIFNSFLYSVVFNFLKQSPSNLALPIILTYLTLIGLLGKALPLAILLSILRYRLWDIDFYINRGIIYLSLTALLGIVFAGLFTILQSLFSSLLGSSQPALALIVPTAVVAGLFNPARIRLRHFVDRRFYGIKLDYTRVLRAGQHIDTASTIGQYRTTGLLGSGGMGEVYAGENTDGKQVAIKVMHTRHENNPELEQRFLREATATARLEHQHIVRILEVGEDAGNLFIAMEYIKGQDWGVILKKKGHLPLTQTLTHLEEIASALDYVHQNGIVHRDIKPGNIMIEDGTNRAVLMDFGIAKIASEMTVLTGTGQIVGSLEYISPEQIRGEKNVDHRSDVYSFAVMTYQILTGELPFHKANAGGIVMAHLIQPAPDARGVNPDIPSAAARALMRAMSKQADERFDTVSDFVEALKG